MIEQRGKDIIFKRPGFPLGIVTDGDPLDRPEGSLSIAENVDYDYESGILQTRNGTVDSELLDGLELPDGYSIMPGGFQLFSFNEPIDRQVAVLFAQNDDQDVKIFINNWFNPPQQGASVAHENEIAGLATNTWFKEWIELTEVTSIIGAITVNTANNSFSITDNSNLVNDRGSWYTGWFAYNPNIANVNKRFACINVNGYQTSGSNSTFFIQNRNDRKIGDLGWTTGNSNIKLLRFPILFHKNPTTFKLNFNSVQLLKTNTSIKALIGQEGNLWIGFIALSTIKGYDNANWNRWYGWWMDYETPPILPASNVWTTDYDLDQKTGISFKVEEVSSTGSLINMLSVVGVYDGFQRICLSKSVKLPGTADKLLRLKPRLYHHYSRRIQGCEVYTGGTDVKDDTYNPKGYVEGWTEPYFNNGTAIKEFYPIYIFASGFIDNLNKEFANPAVDNNRFNGHTLQGDLGYLPDEPIFSKSSLGVYAQGRTFQTGDADYPDTVRYSLLGKEDILASQNLQPVDATDKDKNVAIELLGVNPIIFKNNSIHIINIEGQSEVGWRLIETKSKSGCPYPKTIIRTNYGLVFANEQSIWLIVDSGEPIDLLDKARKTEWLALPNKETFFGEWQPKRQSVWMYVGGNRFWVCELKPQQGKKGWRDYVFNFSPIDLIADEDNEFYLIGSDYAYRVLNDGELTNGLDADSQIIEYHWRENVSTLGRYTPFHHIESILNFKATNKDGIAPNGNMAVIDIDVIREIEEVILSRSFTWNVLSAQPQSIVIKNNKSNRQRAIALDVQGNLLWHKRIQFYEVNSRTKLVATQTKAGYKEIE